MTHTNLIERLEKAEGADSLLDQEIAKSFGWTYPHKDRVGNVVWKTHTGALHYSSHPPTYTHSIDAALSLVERALPRCSIEIHGFPGRGKWNCDLNLLDGKFLINEDAEIYTSHKSPAIAILIALLKAVEAND